MSHLFFAFPFVFVPSHPKRRHVFNASQISLIKCSLSSIPLGTLRTHRTTLHSFPFLRFIMSESGISTRSLSDIPEILAIRFGIDLVSAARRNIQLLRTVSDSHWLHHTPTLLHSIRRFQFLSSRLVSSHLIFSCCLLLHLIWVFSGIMNSGCP